MFGAAQSVVLRRLITGQYSKQTQQIFPNHATKNRGPAVSAHKRITLPHFSMPAPKIRPNKQQQSHHWSMHAGAAAATFRSFSVGPSSHTHSSRELPSRTPRSASRRIPLRTLPLRHTITHAQASGTAFHTGHVCAEGKGCILDCATGTSCFRAAAASCWNVPQIAGALH